MKLPLFIALLTAGTASAVVVSDSTVTAIPDGSSSGVFRSLTVSTGGQTVQNIEVTLSLAPTSGGTAFLGDLYIYLSNGSESAVLLNRPGRRAGTPGGYSDNQSMNVTFSDAAANDVHNFRLFAMGLNTTPLAGPLTGNWQPDARFVDPSLVLDTDPRTAGLNVFTGDLADGTWTIFAADLSTGATHQINSWSLNLTTIPEPASAVLLAAAGAGLLLRRKRQSDLPPAH